MSEKRDRVTQIVVEALGNALSEFDLQQEATSESAIYGDDSILDSTALVSMIVDIEDQLEEEFGFVVSLTDEQAISQSNSPFSTVPAMASYIMEVYRRNDVA